MRASARSKNCRKTGYEAFFRYRFFPVARVGVINLQHREPHTYTPRQIRLISDIGFLVGAEIEMARLEGENSQLRTET